MTTAVIGATIAPPLRNCSLGPQGHYLPAEAGTLSRRLQSHFESRCRAYPPGHHVRLE
jgi:hypothetical protein